MDGNRNWAGWIALGLAGLALLVALSGRMDAAFDLSWQVGAAARPGNITAQPQPVVPRAGPARGGAAAARAAGEAGRAAAAGAAAGHAAAVQGGPGL